MTIRPWYITVLLFLFLVALSFWRDDYVKDDAGNAPGVTVPGSVRVDTGQDKPNTSSSINPNRKQPRISRRGNRRTRRFVPPEGTITITPKDPTKTLEDVAEVKYKWYGLCFHSGIQVGFPQPSIGVDFKLVYLSRLGFIAGVMYTPTKIDYLGTISPDLGLSYRLSGYLPVQNLEALVGYRLFSPQPFFVGLRINL